MSTASRIFKDPNTGLTMTFTKTSAETGGDLLEIKTHYRPNSPRPPAHYHPKQQEHFEIAEGSLTVQMAGEERVYHAGESFDVPVGIPHAMWNAGAVTTEVLWQIRPALESQAFFETTWGLQQDGKVGPNGTPNLLQASVMMQAY
ncbi:MAG: cupin domain-containing protein, partial [Anaerolineae bacterium]|nr:cupin domain-containing protein [Anaerolineae bacterium]